MVNADSAGPLLGRALVVPTVSLCRSAKVKCHQDRNQLSCSIPQPQDYRMPASFDFNVVLPQPLHGLNYSVEFAARQGM